VCEGARRDLHIREEQKDDGAMAQGSQVSGGVKLSERSSDGASEPTTRAARRSQRDSASADPGDPRRRSLSLSLLHHSRTRLTCTLSSTSRAYSTSQRAQPFATDAESPTAAVTTTEAVLARSPSPAFPTRMASTSLPPPTPSPRVTSSSSTSSSDFAFLEAKHCASSSPSPSTREPFPPPPRRAPGLAPRGPRPRPQPARAASLTPASCTQT